MSNLTPMPLDPGVVFVGYTIVGGLGSGPLGDVYLATHTRPPGRFALKVVSADVPGDPMLGMRFVREARAARNIYHPNVVRVHEIGESEGWPWVAMDYVEGKDVGSFIARYSPGGMPVDDVGSIVRSVAEALDYLLTRDCRHQAVKPANILADITEDGPQRTVLSDFATGRRAGFAPAAPDLAALPYAAPEAFHAHGPDRSSDQYALAASAFYLLTGAPPFQGDDLNSLVVQILTSPVPRLSERRPDLRHLDHVFAKALAKDPADRFNNCAEFAAQLAA